MSSDRRRGRGIWSAIIDDPYRKLMAIGLAVLLWFFISNQIDGEITRPFPLDVVGQSDLSSQGVNRLAVVLPLEKVAKRRFLKGDEEIKEVSITFKGPRFRIDAIKDEVLSLVVMTYLGRDWSLPAGEPGGKAEWVEVTAADIRRELALQGVRMEMNPVRVRLEVERRANLTVPLPGRGGELVEIVAEPEQIAKRLRLETAVYTPDKATILGPADGMEALKRKGKPFFRVVLQASGNDRQVSGALDIIGDERLYFEARPQVTMQLLPETSTFTLEVPIVVDDLSLPPADRGRYLPKDDEATRAVLVRVSGNLRNQLILMVNAKDLREWAAANLRLLAYIPRPEAGTILQPDIDCQAYLVPVGPLLGQLDRGRSQCVLEDPQVVVLRRKS